MLALFIRDVKLGVRIGGGMLTSVVFFFSVVLAIPFGVGADISLLAHIAPSILWMATLFACLSGVERLFQPDREDGSLDYMLASSAPYTLFLIVLVKCAAFWVFYILPIVILAPLAGFLFCMDLNLILTTSLSLLVGTPGIVFLGAAGASAMAFVPRSGFLILILVLPFMTPLLIFGVLASKSAFDDFSPFLMLFGLSIFFAVVGSFFSAISLSETHD